MNTIVGYLLGAIYSELVYRSVVGIIFGGKWIQASFFQHCLDIFYRSEDQLALAVRKWFSVIE